MCVICCKRVVLVSDSVGWRLLAPVTSGWASLLFDSPLFFWTIANAYHGHKPQTRSRQSVLSAFNKKKQKNQSLIIMEQNQSLPMRRLREIKINESVLWLKAWEFMRKESAEETACQFMSLSVRRICDDSHHQTFPACSVLSLAGSGLWNTQHMPCKTQSCFIAILRSQFWRKNTDTNYNEEASQIQRWSWGFQWT